MKVGLAAFAFLGIAAGALIVAWSGFAAVGDALALAGWGALAAISLYHLVPLLLCALAWRVLLAEPRPSAAAFFGFRWLRDAGSDLLGIVPAAGEILGIRLMTLAGMPLDRSAASTVADITAEIGSQLGFTLLGLGALYAGVGGTGLIGWMAVGFVALALTAVGLVAAQRYGLVAWVERWALRLAAEQGWDALGALTGLDRQITAIYRRRGAVARGVLLHFIAWVVGIGEAGIALAAMGVSISLASLLVLESLTFAVRSAAFFIPAAAGVQEGGYLLLGGALGIAPEYALAVSLLKRGREIAFGVAALIVWQAVEGRAAWRHLRPAWRR